MRHLSKLFIAFILIGQSIFAQNKIPVIKAVSKVVDIRDGNNFQKAAWNISPDFRPDIYKTSSKSITFYTDIDSITFRVQPNHKYNFVILLNGNDSAFTQIDCIPSFINVLKSGGPYNYKDNREITKFTYTTVNDPDLKLIRKEFKLDSIAGTGNEISQILSLLHWVHNTFPHNGSQEIPAYNQVSDLMSSCIQQHKTLHCGALAWVLNDCYLSMGYSSRHVICLPKDSADFDCHSIISVYSKSLKKWIWIDPTNDAYVMNEKGELLGIEEVRQRLIANKPLILNPDANWNHIISITKEDYLYSYMAKNLYALECYVTGGGESQSNLLLPVNYKSVLPRTAVNKPKCTNNPAVFWAKPD